MKDDLEKNLVVNFGHTVETKTVRIERLSKGGYVIIGTPKLTHAELNELLSVCFHELHVRGI